MSADFEKVRDTFTALIQTHVTAATTVHNHEVGDLGAASPILVISRRGRSRERLSMRGGQTLIKLWLDSYFLAEEMSDGSYTAADAADVIDAVAEQIDQTIDAHQTNNDGRWETISYDGESTIEFGIFNGDGIPRFRERIALSFTVFA